MYKGKSILAVIPARGGSKGVPRKNIRQLAHQPLIAWSIEAGKKSKYVDRLIVSTEDEEIAEIARRYLAEVPFLRPKELALDNSTSAETIIYTIEEIFRRDNTKYDYLLLLQPTSPMRNEIHIDEAIEFLLDKEKEALVSITELEHPVYWNRMVDDSNRLLPFLQYDKQKKYRRQDFEKIYRLNGAIYLIHTETFLRCESFETDNTLSYIMDRKSSVDIDSIEDFELAEFYAKTKNI